MLSDAATALTIIAAWVALGVLVGLTVPRLFDKREDDDGK